MNEREFSERVRTCADRLWRIAWSILQNGADCDDALQNALLSAWRGVHRLRNDAYFETWLTRILINESRSLMRKRRRSSGIVAQEIPEQDVPQNTALADAIGALELKFRIPLILHYMEGYSIKEIGEILRLSETTVKWRMHMARKQLRESLTR